MVGVFILRKKKDGWCIVEWDDIINKVVVFYIVK